MKLFAFLLLASFSSSPAAAELSVFVESTFDYAYNCKPDFPNPPPVCAKTREAVRELNKQIEKSKHLAFSRTKDEADLVVSIMAVLKDSGKYAVTDNSVVFGNTVLLDVDVRSIKVKQIKASVYRDGEFEWDNSISRSGSIKDLRKKLERKYRE